MRVPLLKARLLARVATVLLALWTCALGLAQRSTLGDYLDARITRPLYFKARIALGRDPPLDPRLKILSYDDGSVDRLQRADLTIDDWALVLSAIAAENPRVVLIDKAFAILFDPLGQREKALALLQKSGVHVYVGAFATPSPIKTRAPLDLDRKDYEGDATSVLGHNPYEGWHVYGPSPILSRVFGGAGQILYSEGGVVHAFVSPQPGSFVPHLALFAADTRELVGDALLVNGIPLPLDGEGRMIVSFSHPDLYYDRAKRLGTAVLAAREGRRVSGIEAGDTVLVLPEMYSGSTDFKSTPLGIMPGGFVIAALVNSVISQRWMHRLPGDLLQLLLLTTIGAGIGHALRGTRFWVALLGVSAGVVAGGIWLFAWQDTSFALFIPMLGFWGAALNQFAEGTRKREKEALRVKNELTDAAEMAKAFVPDEAPTWNRYAISALHRSFSEASGDWYAFREAPSGLLQHFVMCDITGHGVQAALMVSICKTMLEVAMRERPEVLEDRNFLQIYAQRLNAILYFHGKGQHLLTLVGLTFEPATQHVHVVSAGHPPPLVFSPKNQGDRRFSQLAARSTVLGLTPSLTPRLNTHDLRSGDELIAYTDGLPVHRHIRTINAFFTARDYKLETAPLALFETVWRQETKRSGRTLDDDVSIVWFKAS